LDKEEVKKYPKQKSPLEELLEGTKLPGMFSEIKIRKSKSSDKMSEIGELLKRDRAPRSEIWSALDRFYRPIQDQILKPREDALKVALGITRLLVLKGYRKKLLKDLLDSSKIADADYLAKNDRNSIKKQLAFKMLWYGANVLDTERVFNGVPAFASNLLGSVELARAFRSSEPVKVIKFKHPAGMENQFNYSFAIFVPANTSFGISDYSG
jgi:hypothetical protein